MEKRKQIDHKISPLISQATYTKKNGRKLGCFSKLAQYLESFWWFTFNGYNVNLMHEMSTNYFFFCLSTILSADDLTKSLKPD